ncbi:MAG: response regulator [Methanoregula sp.]|nr:response regulator [Methanoregula sp.]
MADKIQILYVDDDTQLLDLGKVFLERSGEFSVHTANSASAARTILMEEAYDAIVSDYQMPVEDGITFLKFVRATYGNIPFILFSGKGRELVVIEAINNGADFYIQKGGDARAQFAELSHKIRHAVTRYREEAKRKIAEDALRENQCLLAEALDLAHLVQWESDARGLFTFNDRFYSLYGTTAEREGGYCMGMETYIREFVHPEDRSAVAEEIEKASHINNQTYEYLTEHRILRRNGEIRFLVVRVRINRDDKGNIIRILGVNQDITDRRNT